MTKSMTAFAQIERDGVSWEIRSVNQRYLDINLIITHLIYHTRVDIAVSHYRWDPAISRYRDIESSTQL